MLSTRLAIGRLQTWRQGWPSISCFQMETVLSQLPEATVLEPSGRHATLRTQSVCAGSNRFVSWVHVSPSPFQMRTLLSLPPVASLICAPAANGAHDKDCTPPACALKATA